MSKSSSMVLARLGASTMGCVDVAHERSDGAFCLAHMCDAQPGGRVECEEEGCDAVFVLGSVVRLTAVDSVIGVVRSPDRVAPLDLEVEEEVLPPPPLGYGKDLPSAHFQWKGTCSVFDFVCGACGGRVFVDTDFVYAVLCSCGQLWEVSGVVEVTLASRSGGEVSSSDPSLSLLPSSSEDSMPRRLHMHMTRAAALIALVQEWPGTVLKLDLEDDASLEDAVEAFLKADPEPFIVFGPCDRRGPDGRCLGHEENARSLGADRSDEET